MPVSRKYRNKNMKTSSKSRKMLKSKNAKRSKKNKKMNQRGGNDECTYGGMMERHFSKFSSVNSTPSIIQMLDLTNEKNEKTKRCATNKCTFYLDKECNTNYIPRADTRKLDLWYKGTLEE
jgi:hypothetical protein